MQEHCYHCGAECDETIKLEDKFFCCDGCKLVFQLLDENGMCQYYDLTNMPGMSAKGKYASEKFNYLDSEAIQEQLIQFKSGDQAHVVFYLPQIHCVSCVWLLENLSKINPGIIHSQTQFEKKEIKIIYKPSVITLKELVQLLAFVGYEPMIHLGGNDWMKKKKVNRKQLYKIGIAGFCFSNIMMLSFPDYLSANIEELGTLRPFFIYLNLFLSLPVLLYSAKDFFISAYTGLRQRWLNIDAPIALAIMVTFGRSVYEILTQTGAGYLDSMSGIVFFMLIGRWFQDKSYDSFSFDRDYTSFFPLGVTAIEAGKEINKPLSQIEKGEILLIRSDEMIPADAIVLTDGALVDYSFVTGENAPIEVPKGATIFAGGIQKGRAIQLEVVKSVGQSYITELWNSPILKTDKNTEKSFVHPWSQYFTIVLFGIAIASGLYWWAVDAHKILPAVTSVLIVACPCSLLLTVTFTYGNVLRHLGKSKMYCKNASVLEAIEKIDTIVFDKTGTLTNHEDTHLAYYGDELTIEDCITIKSVTRESLHPLSQLITQYFDSVTTIKAVDNIQNFVGKGTQAHIGNIEILIGSSSFLKMRGVTITSEIVGSSVCVAIAGVFKGVFKVNHTYRLGLSEMASQLIFKGYKLYLLSGDHATEKVNLHKLLGSDVTMLFEQSPADKLKYIQELQNQGHKVMMVGDGLNDAGALQKSDVGIAVTDQTHLFTPASDAILEGSMIPKLSNLLTYAKKGKLVIVLIFILSLIYNVVGMYFATRAQLSPMVAAILMPVSSISIVSLSALLTFIFSTSLRPKS
jgi:Cu+-exporting ATPase